MRLLMVAPTHYDIKYSINPHMLDASGRLKTVDHAKARAQWNNLKATFEGLGIRVEVISARPDLPDMVFSSNHALVQGRKVIMGAMAHAARRAEIPLFRAWYAANGYTIIDPDFPDEISFEASGDAIWSSDGKTLFAGYGYRSSKEAYEIVLPHLSVERVVPLELIDPRFYHLDTCLMVLSNKVAAYVPSAFTANGLASLRGAFEMLIEVSEREATECLAANGFCPDAKHVILQQGATELAQKLKDHGFVPIEVDTGEFIKSGGSIFCLNMVVG